MSLKSRKYNLRKKRKPTDDDKGWIDESKTVDPNVMRKILDERKSKDPKGFSWVP